jgi:D-aminoacyl-tRNA deacylase
MRAVVQRCNYCTVFSDDVETGRIGAGFVVLLGVKKGDTEADAAYIADKILHLRVFEDENDKLNLSIEDKGGELMIVSQFTLYGDARKGRRPSFFEAAPPDIADALYLKVVELCRAAGIKTETGKFRTHMRVALENDGPVTILLDSEKCF